MMEPDSDQPVVSTQKKLQASHDPGWNDPPKWAYSPTPNVSNTPTKRLLNKRVAFPLNSASSTPSSIQSSSSHNLPPPNLPPLVQTTNLTSAPHAPMLAPSSVSQEFSASEHLIDKEQALNDTLTNLQSLIVDLKLKEDNKKEDIQKRLEVMKNMWEENKLTDPIHERILQLSEALKEKDIEKADKIHMDLIMNYAAVCNSWIPAIRHIILEMREKSKSNSSADGK
ncbi:steroid receptor RNA activator 1-like [Chelonus insularis]|uniref:steroid receptor RNA activator 1-like n=1 Tax=Chelonus insularis TaxID=460826 RepID=UPI00158C9E01|nr:steroid receptor RNA activator 1-like [Chelonus insularis]